jgi:hypothetical protein
LLADSLLAQPLLPQLKIEPTTGGSIFFLKNTSAQPLTAYLIELVNYPGSSFSMWQDDPVDPIAPGVEKRIPVSNMTVGAVPDYVKVQAALYADGTSAGVPDKVAQLKARRQFVADTARDLIARLEKNSDRAAAVSDLKQAQEAMMAQRAPRNSQAAINQNAGWALIEYTIARVESGGVNAGLEELRLLERASR